MNPLEATRLVLAAGGVPVVAHPMSENRGPALPLEYLGQMADAGLAGVEVYHAKILSRTVRVCWNLRAIASFW